jgi:hypothetical protein
LPGCRGIELWDADEMAEALVALVQTLPRERMDRVEAPAVPGAYIQWLARPSMSNVFGQWVATGQYPAYHGVAYLSLRERLGRYTLSMRGTQLSPSDIWVTLVPCSATTSAVFAERCLQERIPAPMNGLGWGAKVPGNRRHGRCSPIDALVPGRAWAPPATGLDEALARLRLVDWALRLPPASPVWPALPVAGDCRHRSRPSHLRVVD